MRGILTGLMLAANVLMGTGMAQARVTPSAEIHLAQWGGCGPRCQQEVARQRAWERQQRRYHRNYNYNHYRGHDRYQRYDRGYQGYRPYRY